MYTLNYCTGAGNTKHETIEDAINAAQPTYTQESITIDDEDSHAVMIPRWWGVEYDSQVDENPPLAQFGKFGYYSAWEEYSK